MAGLAVATARTGVPDVRGLAFSEAWEKLTLADFTVRVDRTRGDPRPVIGPVIAQDPPPGTLAPRWTRVRVTVPRTSGHERATTTLGTTCMRRLGRLGR